MCNVLMPNEFQKLWNGAVMAYFGVQIWHFAGGTDKNYASRKLAGLQAEILNRNPQIQMGIHNYYIALSVYFFHRKECAVFVIIMSSVLVLRFNICH